MGRLLRFRGKRSQVAVVTEDGTVELNKNVVNGSEPMLRLIGDLPSRTPVAFEAAFGWGWLVQLPKDYGSGPHLVHPAAVQGDRLGGSEERRTSSSARSSSSAIRSCTRAGSRRSDTTSAASTP